MGPYRRLRKGFVALLVAAISLASPPPPSLATAPTAASLPGFRTVDGTITFSFSVDLMEALGWTLASNGAVEGDRPDTRFSFPLTKGDTFLVETSAIGSPPHVLDGSFEALGGLLVTSAAGRMVIGNFVVGLDGNGEWEIRSHLDATEDELVVFRSTGVLVDLDANSSRIRIGGDLRLTPYWADSFGNATLAEVVVGTFEVDAEIEPRERDVSGFEPSDETDGSPPPASTIGRSVGADIIVGSIHDIENYGTDLPTNISAFAIGTIACNAGDVVVSWFGNTPNHPVIAQNLFRMKDGRFEQIGMSWLKHGFATANGNACQFGCVPPPQPGQQLGVGCSDPYSASLNGQQDNLGPRSNVNPHTGVFPYPWSAPDPQPLIGRRLQVHNEDLDPLLNPGARYFVEAHYVHPEDAAAGNQNNNASYRLVRFTQVGPDYEMSMLSGTSRENAGLRAWRDFDTTVVETNVQLEDDGLLILSEKTTDLGNGFWHYDYALQNFNADRGVRSFSIPIEPGTTITNIGFHDVEWHSGEPFDGTDWPTTFEDGLLIWSTDSFSVNPNANALRWSTLYNFRFDADAPPSPTLASIGLFKPGVPASVTAAIEGPVGAPAVCGNGVIQAGEECDPPNGITCDDDCARIPTCGDDILDPGEECDPPDSVLCDAFCRVFSNDQCIDALPLCPGAIVGNTSTASNDGSASCGNSSITRDVWYRYTPMTDGILALETCGSEFDTVLSVHDACPGTTANQLACDDDSCGRQSRITMPVFAEETYVIRVSGFAGDRGLFTLAVTGPDCVPEPPGNDECEFALPIGEGTTNIDTTAATDSEPLEIGECNVDADIWYCYQATCDGTARVALCDSSFDTAVAVYQGCECPTEASAFACNNDACLLQSEVTFSVTTGNSYLIRLGGRTGASGPGAVAIECEGLGDPIRGGQLWDTWWVVNGAVEPTGEHPLYPVAGQQSGAVTFRCKECHGWDYQGAFGAYGAGPHFTGIPGVWDTQRPRRELFDLIKSDVVQDGHGFGDFGLSNQDAWDLVEFLQNLTIDTGTYIDEAGVFLGDELQGEVNYASGGATSCVVCHGADGTQINFSSPDAFEWVGTIADGNPWKLMHKIRFGQPGSDMPSWLAAGGSNQGATDIGRYAQIAFPTACVNDSHCDDGLFCNGAETCLDDACVEGGAPCVAQACDEDNGICVAQNDIRGGKLWDKWWVESGAPTPTGEHPFYPPDGEQSGTTTYRCKECHGWDYKGADGAYGSGDHFTGILGVLGSTLSPFEMFDVVMSDSGVNGHAFAVFGLNERDGWDLVAFMQNLLINSDAYIDGTKQFIGDETAGETAYTSGGTPSCILCHGSDGTQLNFGTPQAPEWVGTVATYNPWELLHKIRVGQPGASMPSWLGNGGTNQGAADIGLYAQLNFPVDCLVDDHCDDGAFCNGAEFCTNTFCMAGIDPCPGLLCDEEIDLCMSGLCDPPSVQALGGRYFGILPAVGADPVALFATSGVESGGAPCRLEYIQQDYTLGSGAVFLTPAEWGSVIVTGEAVLPETLYKIRSDCGILANPDPSQPVSVQTRIWADVNDDLTVNFNDIYLIIKAFQEDFTLVTLEEADLEPCEPNRLANFADVQIAVLAFQGKSFAEMGCATLCP